MRKFSILLSVLVLAAILLAACGGEATSTNIPTTNIPPVTIDVTTTSEAGTATEAPTQNTTTETPGIPVTGATNPARLSNELDFTVVGQDGSQIGDVDDMVLDLDNARISYVVVGASGREVLVPWDSLTLQTGTSSGQQNAFILQTDQDIFNNAPAFDLSSLPKMGQPAGDWDTQISSYWQSAGSSGGTGASLATATAGTGTGLATSTPGTGGAGLATSTPGTGIGLATATTGTNTGLATSTPSTGGASLATSTPSTGTTILQGVVLASDVLGSTVTLGTGTGTGIGTGLATATPGTGAGLATSTPSSSTGLATATAGTGAGLATSTPGTGTGLATATPSTGTGLATATAETGAGEGMTATIEDMIIDTTTGDIMYIVLNTNSGNDQLIPVPLSMFGWDNNSQAFVLNADAAMLQNAPTFPTDQFPDTSVSGWNSQFDAFWQNNSSGGSGTGTQATATP